jgi:hypothetical protein
MWPPNDIVVTNRHAYVINANGDVASDSNEGYDAGTG